MKLVKKRDPTRHHPNIALGCAMLQVPWAMFKSQGGISRDKSLEKEEMRLFSSLFFLLFVFLPFCCPVVLGPALAVSKLRDGRMLFQPQLLDATRHSKLKPALAGASKSPAGAGSISINTSSM